MGNDTILLHVGSLDLKVVEKYLRDKGWIYFSYIHMGVKPHRGSDDEDSPETERWFKFLPKGSSPLDVAIGDDVIDALSVEIQGSNLGTKLAVLSKLLQESQL